ncbi:hypothetical protein GWO09_01235, partial [candidate division KSB1 bacterium]|nr:hypothetical protein [candidate division KSB1 bacterium]
MENREVYCAALKQIGISERTGNRYAAIALRFSGLDPEIIEQFGVTKMYMLLQAPDEEIEKL